MSADHDRSPSSARKAGFPWLIWLAILVIVALLTLGQMAMRHAAVERHRTIACHALIKAGLEQYKEEYGQYPTPVHPEATVKVSGKDIRVGGARMLYQVLTGDGDSEIKFAASKGEMSDGRISEEESKQSISVSIPKNMIALSNEGHYYLVDGWGRPFQYIKGGGEDALNPTYDLWSPVSNDASTPLVYDAASRRNAEATAKWIKNW